MYHLDLLGRAYPGILATVTLHVCCGQLGITVAVYEDATSSALVAGHHKSGTLGRNFSFNHHTGVSIKSIKPGD